MRRANPMLTALAFAVALTFLLSAFTPAVAQGSEAASWAFEDGNASNQNFNPQTSINGSNAADLQISWIFPIPATPAAWSAYASGPLPTAIGVITTPMIYKGIAYVVTQYNEIFALDVDSGAVVWSYTLPYGPNATSFLAPEAGYLSQHFHNSCCALSTNYLLGGPQFWIAATNGEVYAINALTGSLTLSFPYLNGTSANHYGVEGNLGEYSDISPGLFLDQARGILVTSASGTSASNSGRGFFRGWDLNTDPPSLLWTTYTSPPQDGSDPEWDIQQVGSMTGAWIFNGTAGVNLKTLPAAVQDATLYNDWGYTESAACKALLGGQPPGGVGEGWGGPWVEDPYTGVVYVTTNNRNPYDSPCTPGPDLWSASILALNIQSGKLIWGFQATPHDSWDWDCSWNQILANETVSGRQQEVVMKSCKSGYVFELSAATGSLIWYWTPLTANSTPSRCAYCQIYNPLNKTQMDSAWPAPGNKSYVALPANLGGFESDMAFDPGSNVLIAVNHDVPGELVYVPMNATDYQSASGITGSAGYAPEDNATAYGIDAATGQVLWKYFIPDIGYTGGVTVSGGLAYLTLSTGYLVALNDQTGAVVESKLIGGPLNTLPAIGEDADDSKVFILLPVAASQITWAQSSPPGDIVALSLGPNSSVTTATVASVQTVTSTTTVVGSYQGLYGFGLVAALLVTATALLVYFDRTRRRESREASST